MNHESTKDEREKPNPLIWRGKGEPEGGLTPFVFRAFVMGFSWIGGCLCRWAVGDWGDRQGVSDGSEEIVGAVGLIQ